MVNKEESLGKGSHISVLDWQPVNSDGGHKSAVEIEHDIEITRHDMDATMDALGDKMHPRHFLDQIFELFQKSDNREHGQQMMSDIVNKTYVAIQENPVPTMLIGAGVAWIAWSIFHQEQQYRTSYPGTIGTQETGGPSLKEKIGSVSEKAVGSVKNVAEKVSGKAQEAQQQAQSQQGNLQGRFNAGYQENVGNVNRVFQDYPLISGLFAFVGGIIAGLSMPPTQTEKSILGRESDELKEKAKESVDIAVEKGKESGEAISQKMQGKSEPVKEDWTKKESEKTVVEKAKDIKIEPKNVNKDINL